MCLYRCHGSPVDGETRNDNKQEFRQPDQKLAGLRKMSKKVLESRKMFRHMTKKVAVFSYFRSTPFLSTASLLSIVDTKDVDLNNSKIQSFDCCGAV